MERQTLHDEMEAARLTFVRLAAGAGHAELRRRSSGTRWTNRQLLFHMVLGYLIIRALGNLVRLFSRLPRSASRRFAAVLNAATPLFDQINYVGSWAGGQALTPARMCRLLDRTVAALHRRLDVESERDLARGMHYPTRWDPFFHDFMTLAEVYHFPTQHFDFHRRQLTLGVASAPEQGPESGS
ncbi:hypothetical protein GCM10023215_47100 [Pseudonocardia yuanmonensis]|uniref:DinB-like domain-containing protein n=1 Tax=Pseudonocardia yuanmonensis TaxID=1095914 RepID=A0ABP8X9Q2_9PSEU